MTASSRISSTTCATTNTALTARLSFSSIHQKTSSHRAWFARGETFIALAREARHATLARTTGAHGGHVLEPLRNRIITIVSNTSLMLATMGIIILESPVATEEHHGITLGASEEEPIESCFSIGDVSMEFYINTRDGQHATLVKKRSRVGVGERHHAAPSQRRRCTQVAGAIREIRG